MLGPSRVDTPMLARRLTTILPTMTLAEAIEPTRIHSVAGLTDGRTALVTTRPFRAPHHPSSDAGLIGGGQVPMLGGVSLAHHGMLFLDELPEFKRHVLEVLRQPLEESVTSIQSPARPQPLYVGGIRQTGDGREGCRPGRVATHLYRDGYNTRCITVFLLRSCLCSLLVLFA